ncbi:MAG: CBS domain-containing protein [Candidatus Zixiibacteriota bacterium]
MIAKDLIKKKQKKIITAGPSTSVDEAMNLMISNNIGCLPIIDAKGKLIGIVSDKDIFRKIHETRGDYHSLKLEDVMTSAVIVGLPEDNIEYIAGVMDKNYIRHVPILEQEQLVGLISLRDILKVQTNQIAIENRFLQQHLDGIHQRDKSGDF